MEERLTVSEQKIPSFRTDTGRDTTPYEDSHVYCPYDVSQIQHAFDGDPMTDVISGPGVVEITQYAHPDHASFQPITFDADDVPAPPDGEFAPRRRFAPPDQKETVIHPSNGPKTVRSEEEMMAELDNIDKMFGGL